MKMENGTKGGETLLKYGRDHLLQLRMHPTSLHKPDLPECEVVKDRLYLHQVDNMASDIPLNPYSDNFRAFMRPENIAKFLHQYSYSSRYAPRNSSYYSTSGQKSNSAIPLSKYQHSSFSPNYFSPVQKSTPRPSLANKADASRDDFFENMTELQTTPWFKEAFSLCESENAWNVNQNIIPSNICASKRENTNVKSKKKLSIIDPKTGRDILDDIGDTSTTLSQSSLSSKENTEDEMKTVPSENIEALDQGEKNVNVNGISIISDEEYQEASVTGQQFEDSALLSQRHQKEFHEQHSNCRSPTKNTGLQFNNAEYENNEKKVYENIFSKNYAENETFHSNSNIHFGADIMENEELDKSGHVIEMLAPYNNTTSVSDRGKSNLAPTQGDSDLKERVGMLKDKIYAMRQEQQKMFILQSFLRFKKHQLDESFRSLDDKKIDMVNWEYNLYNKAKKLHEKEQWIEAETRNLKKKEKELEEKEKWLTLKVNEMEHQHFRLKRNASQEKANGIPKESGKGDALSKNKTNKKIDSGKENHQTNHNHPEMAENCDETYAQPIDYSSGDVCLTVSINEEKPSHISKSL